MHVFKHFLYHKREIGINNFLCKYLIKQLNPPFSYSTRWKSLFKEALATILTKKNMFWKLVNSFKMMK